MNFFAQLDERDKMRKSVAHKANVIRYDLLKLATRIENGDYASYYHARNYEGLREVLDDLKKVEESVKELLKWHTEKPKKNNLTD